MRTTRRSLTVLAALLAALALLASGCASSEDTSNDSDEAAKALEITGAWARTSPSMTTAGATYLEITSDIDDRLESASIDPSIADRVEIHETTMMDSDDYMDNPEMDGAMTMREVTDGVELPAGETIAFEPGGYHFMMLDLASPLEVGDNFELTLTFENAGDKTVAVEVGDEAP